MMATVFNFTSPEAQALWDRASPTGDKHKTAFAWRESPAAVDRAVTKVIRNMVDEQRAMWLADCLNAGEIQSRYRGEQLKAGERIGRPKGLAVWVNSGDWASEVGSTSELKQKQNDSRCRCGQPVTHAGQCLPCYEKSNPNIYRDELRAIYSKNKFAKTGKDENLEILRASGVIGRKYNNE